MRQSVTLLAVAAAALLVKGQDNADDAPQDETDPPTPDPTPLPPGATPAPTVATPLPPVEVTKYCDDDDTSLSGRCSQDDDPNGRCNQETFACECSDGYGPKKVSDTEWSYAGCYEEKRETNAMLTYDEGNCDNGEVDTTVQKTLLDAAAAATGGKVSSYAFVCASISLIVTLEVPATKAKELEAPDFSLSTVVATKVEEKINADDSVKQAIQAALGEKLTPTAAVEVAPSTLPPPVAPPGETPVPTTPAPTKANSAIGAVCDTVANAKLARVVKEVCTALQCNEGYVRKQQAGTGKGAICEVAPANTDDLTCLFDGDCPANLVCQSEKCVAATPVPTKATVKEEKSFEFDTETCRASKDCRVNGDATAACDVTKGECTCSSGYEHLSNTLKTCVPAGATTVQVNLLLVFGQGNCETYSLTAQEQTKTILRTILGGTVDGFAFSCGSTAVTVSMSAARDKVTGLAGESVSSKFNTERAQGTNSELAGQGDVTLASMRTYSDCALPYTTRAFTDSRNRCQALVCMQGATLQKNGQVSQCRMTATRGHVDDSDDDLTDGEWAGIAIGIVIFVVVVAGVVFFFMRSSGSAEAPAKETEPTAV